MDEENDVAMTEIVTVTDEIKDEPDADTSHKTAADTKPPDAAEVKGSVATPPDSLPVSVDGPLTSRRRRGQSGSEQHPSPSPGHKSLLAELKMEEGKAGSLRSLSSSSQRPPSPASTVHSHRFDSPLSSVSRPNHKKASKQPSIVCSVSHIGSSLNLSLHREDSLNSLHSDDSFHQPTHTVISPNFIVQPSSQQSVPGASIPKSTGRFSVSPVPNANLPVSNAYKRKGKGRVTRSSECSHESSAVGGRQSPDPDMQFEMSDMSVQEEEEEDEKGSGGFSDQGDHEKPLLPDQPGVTFKRTVSMDVKQSDDDNRDDDANMDIDFDAYLNNVEENQQTVQSRFSVNTQDSATFEHAPLQCGNIRFIKDTSDLMSEPKKHYMCVKYDTPLEQVTEFMSKYWGMRNPKIVLSVISATETFKPWKSQRLKDDFQKGIIKAANTTEMWIVTNGIDGGVSKYIGDGISNLLLSIEEKRKAANTTEMWIVTNGIDGGVSKYIGDAISEYNIEQQNSLLMANPLLSSEEKRRKRLTVIGIVPKDTVPYGIYFDGTEGVQIKNVGQKMSGDIYELNPDHTHFVMVEDDASVTTYAHLRCQIEKQFRQKIVSRSSKRVKRLMSFGSESEQIPGVGVGGAMDDPWSLTPMVGLLVQGSPKNIDQVLFYIQNKMPVVVLKGSGGLADMIGFVYEEYQEKGFGDPDYEENFLKPELIKMILRNYGSRFDDNDLGKFSLRDKIIQAVKMANEGDSDSALLTVFSIKGWGASMLDLDKYILRALFKGQKQEKGGARDQLTNDLHLTIDWNRPDLAWEIFQQDFIRIRIDKKMFEQSLLKKDREEFVDLFLTQGVKVHKYLNHRKLKTLFDKAEDREFFVNICLEGVLGWQNPAKTLPENFIGDGLNRLIYKLSWIRDFIQPYELSMSSTGHYVVNSAVAERKAINSLMIWAVLMNRHRLAVKLWNRCDEPIGIALICSRMFREMTKYTMEQYRRTELEENAKEFGQMALGALAICWRDSSIQAYNMLGRRLTDFNNKSVIEIAHDAGYIHFLAHPCCQKWLTKMFFGNLQVKELDWGLFRLPYWFKILISAFFIFPMYLWITFIPPRKKKVSDDDDINQERNDDSSSDGEDDDFVPRYSKSAFDSVMKKNSLSDRIRGALSRERRKKELPFYTKLYLLWTAPITKFWTTQVFYFAFLGLFCLATLWPACGNQYLDLLLWAWTAVIEMELVCRVYMKYHKFKTLSLVGNCVDILIIMGFLVMLLVLRVLHGWANITNYIHAKTFMCYGLIYFFYRLLGVYLPISPTLGPMLLRFKRMVKHDFVAFIRMFLIFMIVGGVTIHAVIYPNWPLGTKMIRQVLTRPMYSMFLTPVADLDGDPSCTPRYDNISGYCAMGQEHFEHVEGGGDDDSMASSLAYCPYSSLSGYVITLQYLFICKLILVTLLFAMFSLTIGKIDKEASQIWKFQRYALIADFIERYSLPPPFTVFSFVYLFVRYFYKQACKCKRRLRFRLSDCCFKDKTRPRKKIQHKKLRGVDDAVFWKRVAREYVGVEESKIEKDNMTAKHGDILVTLQDDLKAHRKSMKRLGDRVVELERMIRSSRLYLEDIAHKLEKTGGICMYSKRLGDRVVELKRMIRSSRLYLEDIAPKLEKTEVMGITNVKGRFIHVAARQSPYPGTSRTRFPVFDKYVPWEMTYDVYDPKTYSRAMDQFPEAELVFVDVDIIDLFHKKEERAMLTEEDVQRMSPLPEFKACWNSVETYRHCGERREIDRRSWIHFNDQPLRYAIDPALEIPLNPLGRTGMRGKGNLWRWGPNHVIKAVCTRWRRKYGPDLNTMTDYLYVEGKRVLEFIAVQKEDFMDNSYGLPGGVLHGLSNPYSILCRSFMTLVFDEQETGQYSKFDQSEMIQFFAQFATAMVGGSSRTSFSVPDGVSAAIRGTFGISPASFLSDSHSNLRMDADPMGFSASLLYKGYLDDPRNTDNAWVEAEVWNFHYDLGDNFDLRLNEESSVKWKEVSPYVKMFGNETVIVQEAARIHDAYH